MKKTFSIDSTKYTVIEVTAIASCDMDTADRQNALLVVNYLNGEKFEKVVFGYELPETEEDFEDMCSDSNAWESDCEVLKTVRDRYIAERSICESELREPLYFPDDEYCDSWFGSEQPVCLTAEDIADLANGWAMTVEELMEQVHEASDDEIFEWGVTNG